MVLEVGDKVLVMPALDGTPFAIKLEPVEVGDPVILYNLKNDTKIAVPRLQFEIGDHVFASPSFNFAGFDFKLDFDINLIPLILDMILAPTGDYYLEKITDYYIGSSGDAAYRENCLGSGTGDWTYMGRGGWFVASLDLPRGTYIPNNATIEIKERTGYTITWTFTTLYDYTISPWTSPTTSAGEVYSIWIQLPDKIKIMVNSPAATGPGNIERVRLIVP